MAAISNKLRSSNNSRHQQSMLIAFFSFVLGCIVAGTLVANVKVSLLDTSTSSVNRVNDNALLLDRTLGPSSSSLVLSTQQAGLHNNKSILSNVRILIVLVAFDFSQQPHLEEVLESYRDLACTGGPHQVDIIIHATVAWPVTLIDMLNARLLHGIDDQWCSATQFSITVSLQPKSMRLFLVDQHRAVFYEKLDDYDLFIYSEDDIRVTPTTVATYWYETQRIAEMVQSAQQSQENAKNTPPAAHFNVGIVRYEYNYPANVIMDDNTRHATQNVTRVYWEHSSMQRPVVGNLVHALADDSLPVSIRNRYMTMQNHHQGMFLATQSLLEAWRDDPKCQFHNARPRPARNGQPTEGTQRVWMSSQMLYGGRHCGVQQVLPKDTFQSLTVWHLPNKNYRRVGKYRNRKFADGTEQFVQPHASLLTAMELHLAMVNAWDEDDISSSNNKRGDYKGIQMVDEVRVKRDRTPLLERRMREYEQYVHRGGVLSREDREKTGQVLMEES